MSAVEPIAWAPVLRIRDVCAALFGHTEGLLGSDVPEPVVSLDLPCGDPEPLHVFVLTNAHDFSVQGFLSNMTVRMAFDVYQSLLLQVPLVDNDLGGTVEEVGAPQVADYRTWVDADGRRHAGYRLSFNMTKDVAANAAAAQIVERI